MPVSTVARHGGVACFPAAAFGRAAPPPARLMSAYDDLLAAVKYVRDRTGDPNAWQTGLAPAEVTAVITPTTRPDQVEAILRKIRQQHPGVFGAGATPEPPVGRPPAETTPDRESGEAADAIAHAEAALAQQNSASSQLDMQVVSAILNAHLRAVDGRDALTRLQQETEAAVRTRSDLDTPAGARDFQRFLIGKLRDIREVVLNASLDDTSKSALMAAWTSLYDASKGDPKPAGEQPRAAVAVGDAPAAGAPDDPDAEWDPLLDSLFGDGDGLLPGDVPGLDPTAGAAIPPASQQPFAPAMPTFGGGSLPGLGSVPGSMAGWDGAGGLSGLRGADGTDPALEEPADDELPDAQDQDPGAQDASNEAGDGTDDQPGSSDEPTAGPTPVTLPDGETVTAASPQLAAAIKAAVAGTPIAEAFQQQGMIIPPPGTAVPSPIDSLQVTPGDIGMFTDRHALALSPGKALLDGQIQRIATVSGPSFLGWEHPPAATAAPATPAKPDPPTPTRPATSSTT